MLAKLVQFQVYNEIMYALDIEGTLWKNLHPPTSNGWKVVPGPTLAQHGTENRASAERSRVYDISEKADILNQMVKY